MNGSLLHSFLILCAAGALLLQHAAITPVGQNEHEHCVHCTATYCTMGGCACGHPSHAAALHGQGSDGAESGVHPTNHASDRHQDHSTSRHHDVRRGGVDSIHATQVDRSTRSATVDISVDVSIEPCDSSPSGIITLTLDKFLPRSSVRTASYASSVTSSARYIGFADQLFISGIFRPPVST